jgi:DNA-binding MurR/RpiR family transcriptional regulator
MMTDRHETFDTLRGRIRARHDGLSPHLRRLARLALENPNGFALRTIAAIAADAEVQPSTLIRFAKEFGYDGFSSMQQVFRVRLIEGASAYREEVYETHGEDGSRATDPMQVLTECVDDMASSLERLKRRIDPDALKQAVDILRRARHVYVAGLRRSRPIAAYLAYGLMRVERPCSILDFDAGMATQQVANMGQGDVLAAVAFAEYSPPVVDAVKDAHLRGIPVLAITDVPSSPLALNSTLAFLFDEAPRAPFRPISGPLALAQTLVVMLSRNGAPRDLVSAIDARETATRRRRAASRAPR